jgi:hypothetical protein
MQFWDTPSFFAFLINYCKDMVFIETLLKIVFSIIQNIKLLNKINIINNC